LTIELPEISLIFFFEIVTPWSIPTEMSKSMENARNLEFWNEFAECLSTSNMSHIHIKYSGKAKYHFGFPGILIWETSPTLVYCIVKHSGKMVAKLYFSWQIGSYFTFSFTNYYFWLLVDQKKHTCHSVGFTYRLYELQPRGLRALRDKKWWPIFFGTTGEIAH
jgi:hypothetical protein